MTVTFTRDKLMVNWPAPDALVDGRKVRMSDFHVEKPYSVVSVRDRTITLSIDGPKSWKPIIDILHFADTNTFWMTTDADGNAPAANAPRQYLTRVH